MRAVAQADRGRAAADLLHRDAMGEIAHAAAAQLLLDRDAVQAERAHLRPQLDRKAVVAVDLGGDRRDLVVGEVAHGRAQHVDLGAEIVVERREARVLHALVYGTERRFRRGRAAPARCGENCVNSPLGLTTAQWGYEPADPGHDRLRDHKLPSHTWRIVELDGIRGCACLLVVIGHYFGEVEHGLPFLRQEWIGVDLFFCLSGFLIGGILLDNRDSPSYFGTFYIRRGFRIFPIYYLTISLVLLALLRFTGMTEPTLPPGTYYGYLQNIAMSFTAMEVPHWLMPTWTLCVEEQFYLLLPVIVFFTPPRWLARILLLLTASASLFRLGLVLISANKLALFMLPPTEWDLLFLGVLGAYARRTPALWARLRNGDRRLLKIGIFTGLAAVPILALVDDMIGWRSFDVVGRLALGLALTGLVLLLVSDLPEGARFRSPVLRLFGLISYGLYLIHQPVSGILHKLILDGVPDIGTPAQLAVTILAIAASIGLAYLSWVLFESPLIRVGHRWSYREPVRRPVAALSD